MKDPDKLALLALKAQQEALGRMVDQALRDLKDRRERQDRLDRRAQLDSQDLKARVVKLARKVRRDLESHRRSSGE